MRVLVTGANGMLGQDLCPILKKQGYEVIKTDIQDLDITDFFVCKSKISEISPDIVIHCAAYTDVEGAEKDFETAQKINVFGTENIAKICAKNNIILVYISTDYVFDGEKNLPYTTQDIPNPINNYGLTKFQGEKLVKELCVKHYIIRTSWLYGINGKNFVNTMLKLTKDNKEIKVVTDQIGSPTWSVELSEKIIEIIRNKTFGIYHVSGEGCVSWHDFAQEIFAIKGLKVNLLPCLSSEYTQFAKRPKYSVLKNSVICAKWEKTLKKYLLTF